MLQLTRTLSVPWGSAQLGCCIFPKAGKNRLAADNLHSQTARGWLPLLPATLPLALIVTDCPFARRSRWLLAVTFSFFKSLWMRKKNGSLASKMVKAETGTKYLTLNFQVASYSSAHDLLVDGTPKWGWSLVYPCPPFQHSDPLPCPCLIFLHCMCHPGAYWTFYLVIYNLHEDRHFWSVLFTIILPTLKRVAGTVYTLHKYLLNEKMLRTLLKLSLCLFHMEYFCRLTSLLINFLLPHPLWQPALSLWVQFPCSWNIYLVILSASFC